jgi:hypothetical protein
MSDITYIFKEGNVYTMLDGAVESVVKEADFAPAGHPIDGQVEMPAPPADLAGAMGAEGEPCRGCGQPVGHGEEVCPHCGTPLGGAAVGGYGGFSEQFPGGPEVGIPGRAIAQTVETPGGMKGRVLARTPAMWGEEVTVRFDNGTIARIPVDKRLTFANVEQKTATSPIVGLDERLAATYTADRASLLSRYKDLKVLQLEAKSHIAGASDTEAADLDRIIVQAANERLEIESALGAIGAADPVEPFADPSKMAELGVEQASTGGSKADWLSTVHDEMVAEAAANDYEKLMDEGPEAFVASLTASQLADAGTTRIMASRHINSKLAGADEDTRDSYEKVWLGRIEQQRKVALANFKEEVAEKTASQEISAPDESLFM